ncbi:hypothetical protein [Chitinophaga polysaccharea]|uniref:hypothetical protein n=1 Tax=Chitinophaga polysaccharea TaxID=1293035 RepID=UPI001158541F|nr:hypothetical protein [Chitinophaga polysaccharea]
MKKIIFIASILVIWSYSGYAQQSSPSRAEIVKAGTTKKLAATDYSRIFLPGIEVSETQKAQVNKLILEFLNAKRALNAENRKTPGIYEQQQPTLFNNFKAKLAGVLSAEQMNAFLASKPATGEKTNMLRSIFY